jgi:hypothetical protein
MSRSRDRLARLVGRPKKARLTRRYPGDPRHNGFVLGLGTELVLVQQFHDFYAEGYAALRVVDIEKVRSGKHERFWEMMFRGEGLMEQVGISYEVPLDDFRSLLSFLHGRGQHVIIECESEDTEDEDDFFIGRITSVGDESVSILYFDPLGNWDEEPSEVILDDITQVSFDTPYVNTLSKYLKGQPPSNGHPRA